MSSPPHPPAAARLARVSDGARALLDQLEHETRVLERLRRQADAAELVRLRLEQALDALMPALPEAEAQAARQRMRAARRGEHAAVSSVSIRMGGFWPSRDARWVRLTPARRREP